MQNKYVKLALFCVSHLMIDLVGIYILFYQYNHLSFENIALYFIIYNLIAFGTQVIFGYYADRYQLYKLYGYLPFALAANALIFSKMGLLPIIIMTLANAMIHVGGGVLSVDMFKGKSMPAGVFVAPGVLGVFIGGILALNNVSIALYLVPVVLILFGLNYYVLQTHEHVPEKGSIGKRDIQLVGMILLLVGLRAFIGSTFAMVWNNTNMTQFVLVLSIFFGKFMGGILGDRYGFKQIAVNGLIVATPCLMLGKYFMLFGVIGLFLFNLTMAITLFMIMDILKPYKGFAFGLTTLTLVIFFMPAQLGLVINSEIIYSSVVVVGTLGAAHILTETVNLYERRE